MPILYKLNNNFLVFKYLSYNILSLFTYQNSYLNFLTQNKCLHYFHHILRLLSNIIQINQEFQYYIKTDCLIKSAHLCN